MMVRKPGFTALAVMTLGLGIARMSPSTAGSRTWAAASPRVADPDRIVALNGTTRTRNSVEHLARISSTTASGGQTASRI
jgi:hypothetical protein